MKQEEIKKQSLRSVTIKSEPGTSTSPVMQRLPSLRPPRDLTLSAYSQKIPNLNPSKNKKVYIPNLNVQRNKQQFLEPAATSVKVEQAKPRQHQQGRGRKHLIQISQGVFAEGIPGHKNFGRGHNTGGDNEHLRKPTLKLKNDIKTEKELDENKMKEILKDDFLDDPKLAPDFENCPITLPLSNVNWDPESKTTDIKPVVIKKETTINEVFNDVKGTFPGYIFLQLPPSMPGLPAELHETKYNPQSSPSTEINKPDSKHCVLSSLPSGKIGKLQILKSGRARIVFTHTKLVLNMGIHTSYRQDLVTADLDKGSFSGFITSLGPISTRIVATPDWDSMLNS